MLPPFQGTQCQLTRLDLTNLTGVFTQTSPEPKAGLLSAEILCPIFILIQLTNETGPQTLGNLHTAGSNNIPAPGLRLEGCSQLRPNLAVHSGTEPLMEYPSLVVRRPEIQVSTKGIRTPNMCSACPLLSQSKGPGQPCHRYKLHSLGLPTWMPQRTGDGFCASPPPHPVSENPSCPHCTHTQRQKSRTKASQHRKLYSSTPLWRRAGSLQYAVISGFCQLSLDPF